MTCIRALNHATPRQPWHLQPPNNEMDEKYEIMTKLQINNMLQNQNDTILVIILEVAFSILRRGKGKAMKLQMTKPRRGAKPYVGVPHFPTRIKGTNLVSINNPQTHFSIVLMCYNIECLHFMQSYKPHVQWFKLATPKSIQGISITYIAYYRL